MPILRRCTKVDAGKMTPITLTTATAPQTASELMKKADAQAPAAEPKDTVETSQPETGFWVDVKKCARKGADISSHALGGFVGLTLAGLGIYTGALGGVMGGAFLGGGVGALKAAATTNGFLGFWKSAFQTTGAAAKAGMVVGGTAVGYGSWKFGTGIGSVLASIPGAAIGGVVGVGVALRNKLTGGEG